ncbi:cyclic nucleotide-gated cation channel alpha-4 isoform X2 [Alosa alosa]|uniref:cyclic nucleotide-gated cation channel alpha-4 isoform X2 n=1 Tax=Alosa alosa TaxID=278164 RepID=UPI0020150D90|nr:cyclic nucleotide-gated cation channel alpha-4 isoform X2 [Alosa alosa]
MDCCSKLIRWRPTRKQNGEGAEGGKGEDKPKEPKMNWRDWRHWIVNPSEEFYYVWLQVMTFPIFYNWVIIICRACFYSIDENFLAVWLTLDYISDLFYMTDMAVRGRTAFLEQGILVHEVSRLRSKYLLSRSFLLDLASMLPTDLLYLHLGVHMPLVRLNRLLRTSRLSEALDRMETRTAYPNTFRIAKLMLYIFVLIHWNACLYFALSRYMGFGSDSWVYPNMSEPGFASMQRQYIHCFWFSAQIFTTVGDTPLPLREEEYLFMIADLLIAVLVFASIVGNVGNVIVSLRSRDNVFFPNHELVKSYLHSRHISKDLRHRVNSWYQHLHINKKITRENEILQLLPASLRTDIAVSVHLPTMSKVSIFQNCETSLLEELVLKLTPQVYSPGEYVCKKGDVGHEMYIIKEGKLAVVADDGVTQYAVLGDGQFFGEISILNIKGNKSGNRRTANIRSIGHSDLFSLSKEDLTATLSEFPAAKRHLEEKGRQILTKMGILEETADDGSQQERMETRVEHLERTLDTLRTKLARLMMELESSTLKLKTRVEQLELQTEGWGGVVAEGGEEEEVKEEEVKEGEVGFKVWGRLWRGRGGREREREGGDGEGGEEGEGERGEGDGGDGMVDEGEKDGKEEEMGGGEKMDVERGEEKEEVTAQDEEEKSGEKERWRVVRQINKGSLVSDGVNEFSWLQ